MIRKILIVVLLVIAGVLVYAATQPDESRIERSLKIAAPPQAIFPHLNNPASHRAWSPWEKKDPDMQRSYSGPAAGKGAVYEWRGDSNIGAGRLTVIESTPPTRVVMDLEFLEPMQARNTAEFLLQPADDGTVVTWSMHGKANYLSKLMGLFIDFDDMIGREFENGLADLKALVETGS